jgi:transposase
MNIKYIVELNEEETAELEILTSKGNISVRKLKRAMILLMAHERNHTDVEIAKALKVSTSTVFRTRRCFVEEGFDDALSEGIRRGALRKTTSADEALLVATACSKPPKGYSRWTLSLLGDKLVTLTDLSSISYETIRRRLKENDLKPWQRKMWCITQIDAEFIAQMEHILSLYSEEPKDECPIINFDEAMKQLVSNTRESKAPKPGHLEKIDYEYKREGVANLFVFFDRHKGWRHVKVTQRKTKIDFAHCMRDLVDTHYPKAKKIRVVLDNLATHTKGALYKAFEPEEARRILDKIEFHYTPKHASWLNMVEIEIGNMNQECLDKRIGNISNLKQEISAWLNRKNKAKKTINWMFNVHDARKKLERAYTSLN